jgi:hypothetical protein
MSPDVDVMRYALQTLSCLRELALIPINAVRAQVNLKSYSYKEVTDEKGECFTMKYFLLRLVMC